MGGAVVEEGTSWWAGPVVELFRTGSCGANFQIGYLLVISLWLFSS